MRTLKEAGIGQTVKVVKLHGEGAVKRRIMAVSYTHLRLGYLPGAGK